mmetsp:Transcript_51309/g.109068  ORF Transcript_51309/g.109068 Transcript_51309/m.109068 type:complete len:83 (+) Transcript_51309:1355-1603(+)
MRQANLLQVVLRVPEKHDSCDRDNRPARADTWILVSVAIKTFHEVTEVCRFELQAGSSIRVNTKLTSNDRHIAPFMTRKNVG